MSDAFDKFDGIEETVRSNTGSGQYFTPGLYRVAVKQVSFFESQRKKGKWFFAVEFAICNTTARAYSPGQTVSWVQGMESDYAFENISSLLLSLNPDAAVSDINKKLIKELCSPEQPATGAEVDAEAINKVRRDGEGEYTVVNWRSVTGEWSYGGAVSTGVSVDVSPNDDDIPF